MVKQLNYVWLTAEITVQQLQNTSSTLIASSTCPPHVLPFYHIVLVKFYCDIITEAVYAYQHFDQHLL